MRAEAVRGLQGRLPCRGLGAGAGSRLCRQSHESGLGQGHLGLPPCPTRAGVPLESGARLHSGGSLENPRRFPRPPTQRGPQKLTQFLCQESRG